MLGYEILRRIDRAEVPGYSIDPHVGRAVLGTRTGKYLIPPGIDVFELGLIDTAGNFELLPITVEEKPLWDDVVNVLVTEAQAKHQLAILMRSYRALHAMIAEADVLETSVAEWSARGATHPVFGMLRHAAIDVWRARRRGRAPVSEPELDDLHARVARKVAVKIRARVIR